MSDTHTIKPQSYEAVNVIGIQIVCKELKRDHWNSSDRTQ